MPPQRGGAIAPNPVAWAATLGEAGLFLTASATFALACAEIHGVDDLDELQRRVLVLGIILGNAGSAAVQKGLPRAASHWGKHFVQGVSRESLLKINRILGPNFITKYGTKQGVLVLGREVPLGIGIAIGGGGNALMSRGVIRSARRAFGPVRGDW